MTFLDISRKKLDLDKYPGVIQDFRDAFMAVYKLGIVPMTPKVHTLYAEDHLELRLRATGESLAKGCCQGLEGAHSGLRRSDKVHGCHIVHSQVSYILVYLPIKNSVLVAVRAKCSASG